MMTIFDPHDELEEVIAAIGETMHEETITGTLNACFHRLHFLARDAMAKGDTEKHQRLWRMASALAPIISTSEIATSGADPADFPEVKTLASGT